MKTPRDMHITRWLPEPTDDGLVISVPGVKMTGWWPKTAPPIETISELDKLWPRPFASVLRKRDILEDDDEEKHQLCAYVRIFDFPEEWVKTIEMSLRMFTDQGAAISWIGDWDTFLHYEPGIRFLGCYSAYTRQTGFVCFGGLDEPIRYLSDESNVPESLHAAVRDVCSPP